MIIIDIVIFSFFAAAFLAASLPCPLSLENYGAQHVRHEWMQREVLCPALTGLLL
jgi:hypothetical protein